MWPEDSFRSGWRADQRAFARALALMLNGHANPVFVLKWSIETSAMANYHGCSSSGL